MKILLAYFLAVSPLFQLLSGQIGAKIKEQEAICGTWSNSDFAFQMTLVLNRDGSAEFDGGSLKYKVEGNKLILTQDGKDVNYSYKIQSNVLHLSDGDLEDTILFERNNNKEQSDVQNEDFPEDIDHANLNLSQIQVDKQIWSSENLNVTKFRNGVPIQQAKTNQEWKLACKEGRPCWCYYNNNPLLGKEYGILYNWFAVIDSRGLAPAGWHIPNTKEWMVLANAMDGSKLRGSGMEEAYDIEFARVQGGYRNENGKFMAMEISSNWWSTTEIDKDIAAFSVLRNLDCKMEGTTGLKLCGASVRCVKD